tara:strand:- start:261 stop:485 length:225 start_codon:yes stop_codon:yes gene_type:complete
MVNIVAGILVLGGGVFVITMLGSLVLNLINSKGFKFKQSGREDYMLGFYFGMACILGVIIFGSVCYLMGNGILK